MELLCLGLLWTNGVVVRWTFIDLDRDTGEAPGEALGEDLLLGFLRPKLNLGIRLCLESIVSVNISSVLLVLC